MYNKVCKQCGAHYQAEARNSRYCNSCLSKHEEDRRDARIKPPKYTLDPFTGDIEGLSYFMGFIYADGYLDKNGGYLAYLSTDLQIIEDLTNRMHYTKPPKLRNEYNFGKGKCYWNLIYRTNYGRFVELGMRNKKSELQIPDGIELRHFLRGLFDGDGTMSLRSGKNNKVILSTISFLGQELLISQIANILGVKYKLHKSKKLCEIRIGGQLGYDILHYMYDGCTICLDRKMRKFLTLSEHKYNKLTFKF